MKKILIAFLPWLFSAFSYKAMAQEDLKTTDNKKETQEIIIRKKGDKDAKMQIEITGDKVIINGKPLVEFKDDDITINKKKIIIRDGDNVWFSDGMGEFGDKMESLSWMDKDEKEIITAFLGVTSEKDIAGAKITSITEKSAAEKAGLKENDIITKVGETKIDGPESLSKAITAKKPNDEVKVYYLRNGKEKSVKATLQERKSAKKVFTFTSPDGSHKTLTMPSAPQMKAYGDYADRLRSTMPRIYNGGENEFNFDMNSFPRKQKLGLKIQDTEEGNGAKVLNVEENSAAAAAGIQNDDIITEIGGVKVSNTDEVREQLMENSEKSAYKIKAKRNGTEMSFDIKIPKKLKTANL